MTFLMFLAALLFERGWYALLFFFLIVALWRLLRRLARSHHAPAGGEQSGTDIVGPGQRQQFPGAEIRGSSQRLAHDRITGNYVVAGEMVAGLSLSSI